MKTFKKISWALALLSVIAIAAVFSLFSHRASAASSCNFAACSKSDITSVNDWKLTAQDTIIATFKGKTITFTDHKPLDGNHRYDAPPGTFCSGGGGGSGTSGVGSITINDWSQVQNAADPVDATVDIDYYDVNQGTTPQAHCINWGNTSAQVSDPGLTIVNSDSWIWSGTNIVSGDNKTTLYLVSSDGQLYGASKTDQCNGGTIIMLDSPQSNTGNLYNLTSGVVAVRGPQPGTDASAVSGLVNASGQPYYASGKCRVTSGPTAVTILGNYNSSGTASTACVYNSAGYWTCNQVSGGGTSSSTNSSGGGNAGTTCDSNFNSAFSWAICPMLSLADSTIGFFYNQVENQLCFNTGASATAGDFTCGEAKDTSLRDGVKEAWSIFKNIASVLLVIVMLVMVISQAVGGGPFDAYTIRKMLPKLVAAVIIMQLSYILLKFAIDFSNDAGATIGNLMMAPFGGPGHMDLGSMLGRAIDTATGSHPGNTIDLGQTTFVLFAGIASIGLFVWAIPALPLMALYVVTGAFIAFFTLILRKLLIIMLVILAPLAFIVWLLPGMEKYWKLWSDNFSKLLIMFPLIMAMLSGGRIFAYITSLSGNGASMFNPHLALAHVGFLPVPYIASATGFVNIIVVLAAFFAPYFFLPKTYSWGGQLMGQVGKAVENATNKGAEPAKKFLKQREEGYREERKRKSAERYADFRKKGWEAYKDPRKWASAPLDFFRSGSIDPTLGLRKSRRRGRQIAQFAAAGEEVSKQEAENFGRLLDAETRGMTKGQVEEHLTDKFWQTKNGAERFAILQRLAQFKSAGTLEDIRTEMLHGRGGGIEAWNSLVASLYDPLKAISPNLSSAIDTGPGAPPVADQERGMFSVTDDVLGGMTAHGWERRAQLFGVAQAQADFMRIYANDNLRRYLDPSAWRAVGLPNMPVPPAAGVGAPAPGAPGAAPVGPVAGNRPSPGQGAFIPNGEVNIPHNSPEGQIISADTSDINNYVQTQGGWQKLSDGDLMNIYHFRTGEHKARAAEQLRARNLL